MSYLSEIKQKNTSNKLKKKRKINTGKISTNYGDSGALIWYSYSFVGVDCALVDISHSTRYFFCYKENLNLGPH